MNNILALVAAAYAQVWRSLGALRSLLMPMALGVGLLAGASVHWGVEPLWWLWLPAIPLAVAWHRVQLLDTVKEPWWRACRPSRPQWHYLRLCLGASVLIAPIAIGAQAFAFYASSALVQAPGPWHGTVTALLAWPLQWPAVMLVSRLGLSFPAAAIAQPLSWREAWRRSEGQAWPWSVASALATLPASLFFLAVMTLASLAEGAMYVILASLGTAFFYSGVLVLVTVWSMIYRQSAAGGPTQEPASVSEGGAAVARPSWVRWLLNAGVALFTTVVLAGWGMLMSNRVLPAFLVRGLILENSAVPLAFKRMLAPSGLVEIWVLDLPEAQRTAYVDRLHRQWSGVAMTLRGFYHVSFHRSAALLEDHREAAGQRDLPDVLLSTSSSTMHALQGSPAWGGSVMELLGTPAWSGLGSHALMVRDGPHHALARQLVFDEPGCQDGVPAEDASPYLRQELGERAIEVATHLAQGDADPRLLSTARLSLDYPALDMRGPVRRVSSRFCGAWGTSALAFTQVIVQAESAQRLAQRRLTMAWRQEADQWRVLSVSESPESWGAVPDRARSLEPMLMSRREALDPTLVATPGEPYQYVPATEAVRRQGYLVWSPSPAGQVVAEVAEIACRSRDDQGGLHDHIHLDLQVRTPGRDPVYYLPASRVCLQGWPWKWRVWSVTAGGLLVSDEQVIPTAAE